MDLNPQAMKSFDEWKEQLSNTVSIAKSAGAPEQSIVDVATRIGGFLANKVDPNNREQRLLKELWDQGDDNDHRVLASLVTRIVSDGKRPTTH